MTVSIDAGDVAATQFSIGDVHKDALYERGYIAAKRFLLEVWDWDTYLKQRGVSVE